MRRVLGAIHVLASFVSLAFAQADEGRQEAQFQPPETVSVSNVRYPVRSIAFGTVVLEATIGETGTVEEVKVLRDIASLTAEAVRAVRSWSFKPASVDGRAVRSRMTVAATFNPAVENPVDIPLPPLTRQAEEKRDGLQFQPPEVVSAAFPRYPIRSIASGTVVLEVTTGEAGEVEDVKVLRDIASLTPEAKRAVKNWRFKPATFDGKPMHAKIVLAFVFRLPIRRFE